MPPVQLPPEGLGVRLASAGPFSSQDLGSFRPNQPVTRTGRSMRHLGTLAISTVLWGCADRVADPIASPPPAIAESEGDSGDTVPATPAPSDPLPSASATPDVRALGTPESGLPEFVALSGALRVDRERGLVEADGWICLDAGYLEQVACRRGTREHESIIVPEAMPSAIHAALLLAGFTPGQPGRWFFDEMNELRFVPPTGDPVEVLIRIRGERERPVSDFIMDARSGRAFPSGAFIFAGSSFEPNPPSLGPGEHYVADFTGSIVGLVTFGDEVIAWSEVIPDAAEVAEPVWVTRSSELPPPGTAATLILRRPEHRTPAGANTP